MKSIAKFIYIIVLCFVCNNAHGIDLYRYIDALPHSIAYRDFSRFQTKEDVRHYTDSCSVTLQSMSITSDNVSDYVGLCVELHDMTDQFYNILDQNKYLSPIAYTLDALRATAKIYGANSVEYAKLFADYLIYDCADRESNHFLNVIAQDYYSPSCSFYNYIKYKQSNKEDDIIRFHSCFYSLRNLKEKKVLTEPDYLNMIWPIIAEIDSGLTPIQKFYDFIYDQYTPSDDFLLFKNSLELQEKFLYGTGLMLRLLACESTAADIKGKLEIVDKRIQIIEKTIINLSDNPYIHKKVNGVHIAAYLQALIRFARFRNMPPNYNNVFVQIGSEYFSSMNIIPECYQIAKENVSSLDFSSYLSKEKYGIQEKEMVLEYLYSMAKEIHGRREYSRLDEMMPPLYYNHRDELLEAKEFMDFIQYCKFSLDFIDKYFDSSLYYSKKSIEKIRNIDEKQYVQNLLLKGWTGYQGDKQIAKENILDLAIEYALERQAFSNRSMPSLLSQMAEIKYNIGNGKAANLYARMAETFYEINEKYPIERLNNKRIQALTESTEDQQLKTLLYLEKRVPILEKIIKETKTIEQEKYCDNFLKLTTSLSEIWLKRGKKEKANFWINQSLDAIYGRKGSMWYPGDSVSIIVIPRVEHMPVLYQQYKVEEALNNESMADSILKDITYSGFYVSTGLPFEYDKIYLDVEKKKYESYINRHDEEAIDDVMWNARHLLEYVKLYSSYMHPVMRTRYYDSMQKLFSSYNGILANNSSSESASLIYDALLLFHGLKLQNESLVAKALRYDEECKNLLNKYEESMLLNDEELTGLFTSDSYHRKMEEKALASENIKEIFNITNDTIKSYLKDDAVAIEFFRAPYWNDTEGAENQYGYYAALVTNVDSVKIIALCSEGELKNTESDSNTMYNQLWNIVWAPLSEYLKGKNVVYFTPDGELHNLPIESCLIAGEERFNEKYTVYRLSSTREICRPCTRLAKQSKAILYGGLKYSVSNETLNAINKKSMRAGLDDISVETLNEVTEINKLLRKKSFRSHVYKGLEGTESSFKALDNSDVAILHLSTHGFYDRIKIARTEFFESKDDSLMSRSGLLMSGARPAWEGKQLPEDIEDGILTSEEIAQLWFPNLDIVVLSACETGLGDISVTEGVYGLQRGFKKAGAKSILMSLWKVDDVATKLFMIEFYRSYLTGKSKLRALTDAQTYLRNYKDDEGTYCYSDPKFWTSFILLDAL